MPQPQEKLSTRRALQRIQHPDIAAAELDTLSYHRNVQVRLAVAEHPETGSATLRALAYDPVLGVARAANTRLPTEAQRKNPELAIVDVDDRPVVATVPLYATLAWWRTTTAVAAGVVLGGVVLFYLLRWLALKEFAASLRAL